MFYEFQSHAGSIEAYTHMLAVCQVELFQSHAGSIEAGPVIALAAPIVEGFNPTLVRLRPIWWGFDG